MDLKSPSSGADNLNKRFSQFSFNPLPAASSPTGSDTEHHNRPIEITWQPLLEREAQQQQQQVVVDRDAQAKDAKTDKKQRSPRGFDVGLAEQDRPPTTRPEQRGRETKDKNRRPSQNNLFSSINGKNASPVHQMLRKAVPKVSLEGRLDPEGNEMQPTGAQTMEPLASAKKEKESKSPPSSKALKVRLLHKFRKSREINDTSVADPQGNTPFGQQAVKSFFEDPSTDGEEEVESKIKDKGLGDNHDGKSPVFLGNAQQASFRRPVMVECRRSSRSPQMGMTDMLSQGPSTKGQDDVSPLSEKRQSMVDQLYPGEEQRHVTAERADQGSQLQQEELSRGIENVSVANTEQRANEGADLHHRSTNRALATKGSVSASSLTASVEKPDSRGLNTGGLRSHPIQKAPKRQVTFPLSIQAIKTKKWEREDVISTPYPSQFTAKHESGWGKQEKRNKDQEARLTVVLYNPRKGNPKIEHILMPAVAHEISVGQPPNESKVIKNRHFDDFALANALLKGYKNMRGAFLAGYGARTVKDLRLLGYENKCQLSQRRVKQRCFKTKDDEDGFAQNELMDLYRNPRSGKGQWIWWAWVKELPENQESDQSTSFPPEKIALELVEGWAVKRVSLALAILVLCCVLVTVIWIASGVSRLAAPLPRQTIVIIDERQTGTSTPTLSSSSTSSAPTGGVAIADIHTTIPDISAPPAAAGVGAATGIPTEAIASAFGVPTPATGTPGALRSMVVRDSPTHIPTVVAASDFPALVSPAASQSERSEKVDQGSAGSRVGSGVGLGALVLLFGLIMIALWMATSYYV